MTVDFINLTQEEYDNLESPTLGTFYLTEQGIYVGNFLLSNEANVLEAMNKIASNTEAIEKLENKIGNIEDLETASKDDLISAIDEVLHNINDLQDNLAIYLTDNDEISDYAKIYTLYQGDEEIGTINIPNDMVVSSGHVEVDPEGMESGTYLVLELADENHDIIYINVGTLINIYSVEENAAQVQLAINGNDKISATIVASSIGPAELATDAVTTVKIVDGNVTTSKLSTTVQEELQKAETAVQNIGTGATNGTISVDGTNVAVKGLGTAAYTNTTDYDTAGSADAVQNVLTQTTASLSKQINDLVTIVNTNSNNIIKNAESIVDLQSELDTTIDNLDLLGTTVTNNTSSINNNTLKIDDLDTAISELYIGGEQILNGSDLTEISSSSSWSRGTWRRASTTSDSEGNIRTVIEVSDAPNSNITHGIEFLFTNGSSSLEISQDNIPVTIGETYTMSAYCKGSGIVRLQYGNSSGNYLAKITTLEDQEDWIKLSFTLTMESRYANNNVTNVYFGLRNTSPSGSDVQICGMKLELGEYATDWRPSEWDIQQKINSSNYYGYCNTDAETANKIVTCDNFTLTTGARISILFDNYNSSTVPTLNVNGTGAKVIVGYGTTVSNCISWSAGSVIEFIYNGTSWVNVSPNTGTNTVASGIRSFAEGYHATASGINSHAEGGSTEASGTSSHAEGSGSVAEGESSHAEGYATSAIANYSHTAGYHTETGTTCETVLGQRNTVSETAGSNNSTAGNAFVIGNGTSSSNLSNAFRVTKTGATYGLSAFNSSGADYAEYISEWYDGNIDNEDRVGYFVTIKDDLLYKANEGDYVVGITSGNPSIIGNSDENYRLRFEHDDFNRFIYEDVEEEIEQTDENGNITTVKTGNIIKDGQFKWNKDYDPSLPYVERKDRPEWDYVGMIGTLPVRDDGTCLPNHFCKCGKDGVATIADVGYYVIKRISDFVIEVIFK